MADFCVVKFSSGPKDGLVQVPCSDVAWPLPDRIELTGGAYVKASESQHPNDDCKHLARGAVYRWTVQQPAQEATP